MAEDEVVIEEAEQDDEDAQACEGEEAQETRSICQGQKLSPFREYFEMLGEGLIPKIFIIFFLADTRDCFDCLTKARRREGFWGVAAARNEFGSLMGDLAGINATMGKIIAPRPPLAHQTAGSDPAYQY